MHKKILGVLGGMGPAASARFCEAVTEFTFAEREQEHMELLLLSTPQIPDRTEYILGRSQHSPLPAMQKAALRLAAAGAEIIAVPCNTAEYFYAELSAVCPVPILRTAAESARFAAMRGVRKLGIMATEGAIKAGIYQKALAEHGVAYALPCERTQRQISELIYAQIKKGMPCKSGVLEGAARELRAKGCDAAVLGCTELSLAMADDKNEFFIDSLSVLAARAVSLCGYPLSEKGKTFGTPT